MVQTNFEKLRVYQLAEQLADLIWNIVIKWDYFSKTTVGKQMVTAADGVASNISEGTVRGSYLTIEGSSNARGSLYETKNWLRRSYKRQLITDKDFEALKPLMDELVPSLNAYYRSIDKAVQGERTKYEAQRTKYKK